MEQKDNKMSEIDKLFDECFGELASDLPSKVFIRKLQDIILSGRPKKKEHSAECHFRELHKSTDTKEIPCLCGADYFNQVIDEYDNWIKDVLK